MQQNTNTVRCANLTLRSGVVVLIIGGVLLAAGLVIAGVSTFIVTKEVLEDAVLINTTSIEPGLSHVAELKDLPAGRQLLFSIQGEPSDIPLEVRITEAGGNELAFFNITKTPFTDTIMTVTSGDHTLEIKNAGDKAVVINAALLNSIVAEQDGGVGIQDDSSLQKVITYGIGILVGIVLTIAGIVLLIIGAIKFARGKKTPENVPK
jgi:hypothetical protein